MKVTIDAGHHMYVGDVDKLEILPGYTVKEPYLTIFDDGFGVPVKQIKSIFDMDNNIEYKTNDVQEWKIILNTLRTENVLGKV